MTATRTEVEQWASTAAISETYAYDGADLRASQTVSGTKSYLTWDSTGTLPLLLNDGSTNYIYGPGGLPIEQIASEVPTYYHHDQLGSTRMLTNSSGASTGKFTYGAYGMLTGSSGTQTTPLAFAGQYTNAQSGLQYLRARAYDPATGQFLSRDPLTAMTRSPYSYAGDNPLNDVDPSGLCNAEFWTEGFWTEGNCLSESSFNPIPYYEREIEAWESGCSYWQAVAHGLQGAGVLATDAMGVSALVRGAAILIAEDVANSEIAGFTSHGLEQVLTREGVGVSDQALIDAVDNPVAVIQQANGATRYVGQNATVVLNENGEVITAWARNSTGWRQQP